MKDTVYTTVKVRGIHSSVAVNFSDVLGYEPGDIVRLTFYRKGNPNDVHTIVKKVVKLGNSRGCYVDKSLDIKNGEILIVRIDDMDGKNDTRVEVEKGFEDPFE